MSPHAPSPFLRIDLITSPQDIPPAFDCTCKAFGDQVHDAIWMAMNPGWDTPTGKLACAQRLASRWSAAQTSLNNDGNSNTLFLKATLPDPEAEDGRRKIVGFAIWVQASTVSGHGEPPSPVDVSALYPDNEPERRYLSQLDASLHSRRFEVIRSKASASPPAVMVLDLCGVDPAFQGRGIAGELVRWGLDEAARRGGLEAITEASSMGRRVYGKLGFRPDEEEVVYVVDGEFEGRERPSNLFMRTRGE